MPQTQEENSLAEKRREPDSSIAHSISNSTLNPPESTNPTHSRSTEATQICEKSSCQMDAIDDPGFCASEKYFSFFTNKLINLTRMLKLKTKSGEVCELKKFFK